MTNLQRSPTKPWQMTQDPWYCITSDEEEDDVVIIEPGSSISTMLSEKAALSLPMYAKPVESRVEGEEGTQGGGSAAPVASKAVKAPTAASPASAACGLPAPCADHGGRRKQDRHLSGTRCAVGPGVGQQLWVRGGVSKPPRNHGFFQFLKITFALLPPQVP
jgi:hypothetical protein